MDRQNLTLLTDLYELTMMQGYFKNREENRTVIFDAFYRTNPFGDPAADIRNSVNSVNLAEVYEFEKLYVDSMDLASR